MSKKLPSKRINLALQGGGAHGAFTWGVLDYILEDGRLDIDGLSATSAGAMNACVYAYGMQCGGKELARKKLHDFWHDLSCSSQSMFGIPETPIDAFLGQFQPIETPIGFYLFESFTRVFSPYQFNPFNINPLKDLLLRHVDFSNLHHCTHSELFISATNVKTNRIKIFQNKDVTADAVMASACLPMLFQAVEIDGEFYWDGGYMGNPALFPLFYHTNTDDMVVVHINPIERDELPTSPHDILNRVNEISFNSSLLREFRAIAFIEKMLQEDWIKEEHRHKISHQQFYMHSIRACEIMSSYSVASKFTPNWHFLQHLRDLGRETAREWLAEHYDDIGHRSTVNLRRDF
ncbi:MAG: patatin-like phospholipase family protein [Alphaproteobacteria bacterium]|nr:MAG: patatin-like phospholipase family protein [Alphaproteobacteria bacterium]